MAVGIDYLGIERNQPAHETHITLLKAGVVIIEGLRLANVTPGGFTLHCLPLHIVGSDGAPARAIFTT
jgi:arylformamidase